MRSLVGRCSATVGREEEGVADLSQEGKLSARGGGEEGEQGERKGMVCEEEEEEAGAEEMVGKAKSRGEKRKAKGQRRCLTVREWDRITRRAVVRGEVAD